MEHRKEYDDLRIAERERPEKRAPTRRHAYGSGVGVDDGRGPGEAPGDIDEIRSASEFQRDEQRRELVRDDRKSRRRDRQPNQIAYCEARDERPDALQTMAENARDKRGNARTWRRHRDEIYAGENS